MRKWLWLLLAMPAMAQTTQVSGKLQTYSPNIAPNALGNYVEFQLTNCGNNTPQVSGSAVLLSKAIDFFPDSTGALSAAANGGLTPRLYGNDVISCGGAFTSRYSVRYYVGGIAQGPAKFYFIPSTSGFDLTTATPINLQPPLMPPYPNLTTCAPGSYSNGLNKDLSVKCLNLPDGASNAVVVNPTATQEIANQPLVLDGPLSGILANFNNTNGTVNVTMFPGGDLGAQINTAAATCSDSLPCHLYIPPTVKTFSTPVLLPRRTQGLQVTCDRNATLTYTGVGSAFSTVAAVNVGGNAAGTLLDGGCALIGSAAGTAGVHFRPGQGYVLDGWQISGFTAGDGIWVDGANSVTITRASATGNLNGLHITGNTCNGANLCTWDRPNLPGTWVNSGVGGTSGFAANAVKVEKNRLSGNTNWGILENDVIGGSVTKAFGNHFTGNVLEGNGVGAVMSGFTRASTYQNNYFEGNTDGIVLGCVSGTPSSVVAQTGYTAQFCGTADKSVVQSNFFNDITGSDEVLFNFADSPSADNNAVNFNAACLVDNHVSSGNISLRDNIIYGTGSYTCQDGTPGGPLHNFQVQGDASLGAEHFFGAAQVDGVIANGQLAKLNTGVPTMVSPNLIIGQWGAITIWQSAVAPIGTCGGPLGMNILFTPTEMYICSGTWRLVTHS